MILVAPKGSGRTVRTLFREGRGINSSIAVYQDVTGKAEEKAIALGVAVGSGYLYKTTFEKEVYSDLYGERGCLMGGIHGMFLAQYEVLRERGHSPSEAFNETVEEATQSLYPLIGANGMDWMYAACSTTARRGAIDWSGKFKDTLKPVFNELYDSVKDGKETQRSLDFNSQPDYREKYEQEMKAIRDLEIWRAGKAVRYVRATCRFSIWPLTTTVGRFVQRTRYRFTFFLNIELLICSFGASCMIPLSHNIVCGCKKLQCGKLPKIGVIAQLEKHRYIAKPLFLTGITNYVRL